MTSHNSSSFRIFAVWLVMLAFLCGMLFPTVVLAKKEMTNASEGDPGDGMDFSGGGSSSLGGDDSQVSKDYDTDDKLPNIFSLDLFGGMDSNWFSDHLFVAIWFNGQLQFIFVNSNGQRGAIR